MANIYNQKPCANERKGTRLFIYERLFLVRHKIYKKTPLESLKDTINPHTAVTKNENVYIFSTKKSICGSRTKSPMENCPRDPKTNPNPNPNP